MDDYALIEPDEEEIASGPARCLWCEGVADQALDGFYYEPERDSLSEAEAGWYCSMTCWLSAG